MAQYKVLQDIEAEDHILGPLTLRQFIYAVIAVFFLYISYLVLSKNVPFLLALFFPPVLIFGFLAYPFGRDQPTEIWALAKLRFFFKPRKRVWSQSGIKETVIITAPKHAEVQLTDGLSQNEVINRLQALALTLDSRGWAIKSSTLVTPLQNRDQQQDDRLINLGNIPKPVEDFNSNPEDDMLDQTSSVSQHMNDLIIESDKEHRQKIITSLSQSIQSTNQAPNWFDKVEEDKLSSQLKANTSQSNLSTANLHTLSTAPHKPKVEPALASSLQPTPPNPIPAQQQTPPPTNIQPKSAILNLEQTRNLSIETLGHEAHKNDPKDEVTIKLR